MPTKTPTLPGLLTLAQWLSPAFPIGAFSFSHGLEWAVEAGDVSDADGFQAWLSDILLHGAGRNDAILLAEAYRAPDKAALLRINELARALAPSRERLSESVNQGAAFAQTASNIWPVDLPELTLPVAIGAAARAMDLPLPETLQFFLHGFASNLTSCAIRRIPLGQTDGQRILASVAPICAEIAAQSQNQNLDDLGSCSFLADIASMKHETQYSRLFQS